MTPDEVAALLIGHNDRGAKLVVTPMEGDGLLVEASAVASKHDPHFWQLEHLGDGIWQHWPSGTSGPLYDVLRGVAASYDAIPDALPEPPDDAASGLADGGHRTVLEGDE